ncbi:MAG: efflux RND transporter periplasmic adaptor subunit [Calditrichaceae bacterium]|nr:efflux RND transporter periplasmic adaptor subunit [Calditrichaceae bacterium]
MRKSEFYNLFILIFLSIVISYCGQPGTGKSNMQSENDTTHVSGDSLNQDTVKGMDKGDFNAMGQKPGDEDLIPVEITKVRRGSISDYILLSSNLETEVMADVFARVQGIVEKIHKEEGDYVEKGETLLTLEAREYVLAEQRAQVEYQQQLSNYNRLEAMHAKKLLSDDEFERAKFAKEGARIAWEEAKLNLDYTHLKSPISGHIGERLTKIGERIQPTDKLFSVINNSQVIAVVYVPEKSLNKLAIGQKALIHSDNLGDDVFEGWIKRISPVVDPASGTFKVTVGVVNKNDRLRPGMFVNVEIIIETRDDVVLVPKTAIVYENEYMNVYVVRDSVAHKIRLQHGFEDNEKVEALSDIKDGDQIIVVGQSGMKDKTRVKIVTEREITFNKQ